MAATRFRAALAATAALAALLATPHTARACSCMPADLADYADEVTVAFTGRQIERIPLPDTPGWVSTALVLEVFRVYKGRAGPRIEVRTGPEAGTCGISFGGESIVGVAAFGEEGGLTVHLCGSSVSIGELEEVFGSGYPPDETITLPGAAPEETNSFPAAVAVAAGLSILAAGAFALHRLRRRPGKE